MHELSKVPSDTDECTRSQLVKFIRELSPDERLRRACELSSFVYRLVVEQARKEKPEASQGEFKHRLAQRLFGKECSKEYSSLFGE